MAKTVKKKIVKKITRKPKTVTPRKSKDIPVTHEMLLELRDELKHGLNSNKSEIKALSKEVDARFKEVDARFDKVDARFNTMDSKFEKVLSEIHRVGLLVEEQNSRNKFVLDGYTSLNDRIEAQETEINSIKKTIESF